MINKKCFLGKVYVAILMFIFGGMVLHTPITVGLTSVFPDYTLLIKSWKEILMIIAGGLAIYLIVKNKRTDILKKPIIILIAIFALLHLLLLIFCNGTINSLLAGLMIDLRYLLFFALVYIALNLYPNYRVPFAKVGVVGALIVVVFAFLQVFILPHDILKYIGYGSETIMPYMTVDKNEAFIRINSTMRGPNPLGAYAVMVIAAVAAYIANKKERFDKKAIIISAILIIGGVTALVASYSRSAWIAAIVSLAIIFGLTVAKKLSTKMWITIGVVILATVSCLLIFSKSDFVSNIILHDNPDSTSQIDSNDQHSASLATGFGLMVRQPFGAGIGSTGSASMLGDSPLIIENQYLFIAHEAGWLGLIIFTAIYAIIMVQLWRLRSNWFALGVFASGIGLALIGMLLPVWADDVVSIIWWGMAAIALTGVKKVVSDEGKSRT